MSVQPIVKTIQRTDRQFVCPMCAFAFSSPQAFSDHLPGCTGRGFELGRAYVGKALMKDAEGILWVFRGMSSEYAMVKGRLLQCNRNAKAISVTDMMMSVADLRDFSMVPVSEALDAFNRVSSQICADVNRLMAEGCE